MDTRDAIPGGEGVHLGADLYDRAAEIEAVADDVRQTQKDVVRRGEGVEEREAGCSDLDADVGGTEGCGTDLLEVRGRVAGAGDDGVQASCSFSVVVLEGGDSPGDFLMGPQGHWPSDAHEGEGCGRCPHVGCGSNCSLASSRVTGCRRW